ncbi:hypothetical protein [Sphingobacterium lumbrici]|uniref:hypothetical protein n=1 Tax=Sphingobacterium lumbrici TaxID=2559600 RepID=UPI0011290151|nr:hypothetical protein [Sphingobacterium lumbrici]
MNNTFDFNRFFLLLRREWINFGKIYLISLAVVTGVIAAFYGYNINEQLTYGHGSWTATLSFRPFIFIFLGLLFLTMISSGYFADLGQKPKAIIELLIPASKLEKFLASIVYTVILTIGSYFLLFYLIDFAFVSYIRTFATETMSIAQEDGTQVVIDNIVYFFNQPFPKPTKFFLFLPFLLNSLFLLGSIYFRNFHYIKTAISVMIYVACWIGLVVFIMNRATSDTIVVGIGFWQQYEINILKILCGTGIILTLIFWFLSYLRLKEKEV